MVKNKYDNATKEEKENGSVKQPIPLQLVSEVGKDFWLLETEEFRKKVVQDAEDLHAKKVEEWEALKSAPNTPRDFHQYVVTICLLRSLSSLPFRQLVFAGQYLHPVAEAIAAQMQAAVSICIIGPVADRNGEVEVRRYVKLRFGVRTSC